MKVFIQRIIGSPLRFFGAIAFLFSLYFALIFNPFGNFSEYPYRLASFYFIGISIVLYVIAYLRKDLIPHNNVLLRLVGSLLKAVAFLLIIQGCIILFYLVGWTNLKGLSYFWLISSGTILYVIDSYFSKERVGAKTYWIIQATVVLLVFGFIKLVSLNQSAKTIIIFPESAKTEAIIVYGVEGYPVLPSSFFWKKTIHIPDNGLLITSSMMDELPGYKKEYINTAQEVITMNHTFIQDICTVDDNVLIVASYFTPKNYYPYIPFNQNDLQRNYQKLYDSICSGQVKSKYVDTRDKIHQGKTRADWLKIYNQNTLNTSD